MRYLSTRGHADRKQFCEILLEGLAPDGAAADLAATARLALAAGRRVAVLAAGYAESTAGVQINRFCASGLTAIQMAADRIRIGEADVMDTVVARGPHAIGVRDAGAIVPIQDGRDIEKRQNGLGVGKPGDPAYTVDTTGSQAAGIPFRKSKRAQSETDDESWVEGQQSNTLNNFDVGDTRTTHAVVEQQVYENHPNDSRVTGPLNVAPTVVSRFGTGGGNVPLVNPEPHIVQASELRLRGQISEQSTCPTLLANTKSGDNDPLAVHAISFQPGNLCRQAGADPSTTTFPTLKCDAGDQAPHVAHPVVPLDGMNLLSRLGECGETHSMQIGRASCRERVSSPV